MGETSHELTPSLDDGIPYYPTIPVVAGTDDGRLHVSHDGGARWTDVSAPDATDSDEPGGFPGLPAGARASDL